MTRSAAEARAEFQRSGTSVAAWAVSNGFSPQLVYRVLRGHAVKRGQSHRIAVLLGLKEGEPSMSDGPTSARESESDWRSGKPP